MKNLGKKMQQARETMGVSIRDASEATRLRADVIENMESGSFDFPLPEIYRRGFLRIYAAFLKLDVKEIQAEYTRLTTHSTDVKGVKNILGRMSQTPHNQEQSSSFDADSQYVPENRFDDSEPPSSTSSSSNSLDENQLRYIKIGALFVVAVLAIILLVFIISSLLKPVPQENPDIAINANIATNPISEPVSSTNAIQVADTAAKELTLVVTALADTYVLAYPETTPNTPLYSGSMQAGERKEFKSKVPIMIKLTDAERVKLERNSKQLNMGNAKGLRLFKIGLQ